MEAPAKSGPPTTPNRPSLKPQVVAKSPKPNVAGNAPSKFSGGERRGDRGEQRGRGDPKRGPPNNSSSRPSSGRGGAQEGRNRLVRGGERDDRDRKNRWSTVGSNQRTDRRDRGRDGGREEAVEAAAQSGPLHALENPWTIWYDGPRIKSEGNAAWEQNLTEVGQFQAVEPFWQLLHSLEHPSRLELNANYHLFKRGIKPAWEDPANEGGGKWVIRIGPRDQQAVDTVWQNLCLALVGEDLGAPFDDLVTGTVLSKRRAGDRVAVWIKKPQGEGASAASAKDVVAALGDLLKAKATHGLMPATVASLKTQFQYHQSRLESLQKEDGK